MRKGKYIISCLLLFMAVSNLFAQLRWDSLLGNSQNPINVSVIYADTSYMYVSGYFYYVEGESMRGIARWNGTKWDSMGAGINKVRGGGVANNIKVMSSYKNKLYVAGGFSSLGNVVAPSIGYWDGTKWDSLRVQAFTLDQNQESTGEIYAMDTLNNKLYIGGYFDTVAGKPMTGIACWNDTNWSYPNFPNLIYFDGISAMCTYNGSIYVGGEFDATYSNDTVNNILRWDGKDWHSIGGGVKNGFIESMAVYNGDLYVAGYFSKSDGNADNNIQYWDGNK